MKIGLVLPGNIWFCPYVKIYTEILEINNIEYDIISWNRDGSELHSDTTFNCVVKATNRFNKFKPFISYVKYIIHTLKSNNYNKLVVFGPQLGILLYFFLKKHYYNKFILDYRDLSIEQLPLFKLIFNKLVLVSNLNVISSFGFIKYLPSGEYNISHNFNIQLIDDLNSQTSESIFKEEKINILTIGSIRDYESNLEVVKSLGNNEKFILYFIGKGIASELLKKYVKENNINNVFFKGYYEKNEEESLIKNSTFLNIFYPKIKSHSSAMSNRFYNSLIYKRPMIVTSKSVQGDFVEKFNLGLSINNCNNLAEEIQYFKNNFDYKKFDDSTNKLLNDFKIDYDCFKIKIENFIQN